MIQYDPDQPPDPAAWLALDEGERVLLVEQYHRDARVPLPKGARKPHAVFHTIVENQLALEDQVVVRETLRRLMDEGLARHEAVHAIGSVLAEHVQDLSREPAASFDNARYHDDLRRLSVEQCHRNTSE